MFLTVQKSIDNNRTTVTKLVIKLSLNQPHNMYTTTDAPRKAKWKNVTYGCLKQILTIGAFSEVECSREGTLAGARIQLLVTERHSVVLEEGHLKATLFTKFKRIRRRTYRR
jgi:hypothetical protein